MKNEKIVKPVNGWLGIILIIIFLSVGVLGVVYGYVFFTILFGVSLFMLVGLVAVTHNESCVLVFFGRYVGTIKEYGFYWVNPLINRKTVSLKPQNFNSDHIKVTDKVGNPITIGLVLVWKVEDTFKATFETDDYRRFVSFHCDAALIKLADHYPYDNVHIDNPVVTLIAGGDVVNKHLEEELRHRLQVAGISVIEARLSYVAYAPDSGNSKRKKSNGSKKGSRPR